MFQLRAKWLAAVPAPEGQQADVSLVEPNGEEHTVRCWVRVDGTEIGGDKETMEYLNRRYGPGELSMVARDAVLSGGALFDLERVLSVLSNERPIFHSEAYFQHALAWTMQCEYPSAKIRLEKRILGSRAMYLDLWMELQGQRHAIELKHQVCALEVEHGGERYSLKNQGAEDNLGYDFARDIARLEEIKALGEATHGWAVLLTNESLCWRQPRGERECNKDAFRLHEGAVLAGQLSWRKEYQNNERAVPIHLKGAYTCCWKPFSVVQGAGPNEFRYLMLAV
jgi:hypothetical protein